MSRFNKTTAAAIAGAVGVIIGALWPEIGQEVVAAGTVLVTTFLVWLIPNSEA